ncbi:DUF3833 family protein [Reyranella sp.]|uniref:DUF3833 family protein n=1 Tax=Reyranella sp. TaxID=1929291 RepID=UPI003BAC1866
MIRSARPLLPVLSTGLVLALLGGCALQPTVEQGATDPPLALEAFFPGVSTGDGVFVNTWTGAERRFRVRIDGAWDGTTLTLAEDFDYDDGERDRKTWRLRRLADGSFSGTREDVVGQARIWTEGRVVRLQYKVKLAGWTLGFSDVLALRPDGTLINRATVGKWGIRLGRVELVLRKQPGDAVTYPVSAPHPR